MKIGRGDHQWSGRSLAQRVLRAGGWTIFGYGANQVIRLAGNLILTRLLYPEAFGLMAIVQAVIFGAAMLTDVGLEQSIIQNKKGDHAAFLNTAWTLQLCRGVLIWLALFSLASPIASVYSEPMLAELLPAVGLTAIIGGLNSTNVALANRELAVGKIVLLEVGSYSFGLLVTIVCAWVEQTVWSLVIGNVVGVAAKTVASHLWFKGVKNRFAWDAESVVPLLTFGKWIVVSSTLLFLTGEGSRLLLAGLLDVRMLAFYTLALTVDQFPGQVALQFSGRVLFPAYAEVIRKRPDRLYAVFLKSRLLQIAPAWLASACLVIWGPNLMRLLYDERYADSGWMLQILAVGSLAGTVANSYNGVLWAKGLVSWNAAMQAVRLIAIASAMLAGSWAGGATGVIVGIASVGWLMYPVNAIVHSRLGLWQPKIDLPFLCASLLMAGWTFNRATL